MLLIAKNMQKNAFLQINSKCFMALLDSGNLFITKFN